MVKATNKEINNLLEHLKTFDVEKDLKERSVCPRCSKHKNWFENYCRDCEEAVVAEARENKQRDYLEKVSQNSLEIRIRNIEEWVYKHEQNHPTKEWRMR